MFQVVSKLKQQLKQLHGVHFHGVSDGVQHSYLRLISLWDSLHLDPLSVTLQDMEYEAQLDYVKWRKIEKIILCQQTKEHYLQHSDENLGYYHTSIKQKRR